MSTMKVKTEMVQRVTIECSEAEEQIVLSGLYVAGFRVSRSGPMVRDHLCIGDRREILAHKVLQPSEDNTFSFPPDLFAC